MILLPSDDQLGKRPLVSRLRAEPSRRRPNPAVLESLGSARVLDGAVQRHELRHDPLSHRDLLYFIPHLSKSVDCPHRIVPRYRHPDGRS
jgi:hypothetical protein